MFKNLKKIMAKKMKATSLDEYDSDTFKGKTPRKMGIYHNGEFDPSFEKGHGMRKGQGLTNYINFMLKAEKEGKFKFDRRRPLS